MAKTAKDAIALLKADHKLVKGLFKQFEESNEAEKKVDIAQQAIFELKIHDAIEEEIFYPRLREALPEKEVMNEADEEHHLMRLEIAELDKMEPTDERYPAKFTVLAEMVRHHIKEEETEMMPEARKTNMDMKAVGQEMMARKQALQSEGLPKTKEAELVGMAH